MTCSVPIDRPARKSVLVVDDDEDMLAAIFGLLSPTYLLTLASDGIDGFEKASQSPTLDLIIADITMPRLDGIAMILRIRETVAMRCVPIIFLSGHIFPSTIVARLGAGPFTYLAKTADPTVLMRRVHRALGDA